MVDVERLVLAGILVDGTKCLRLGPRFERTPVLPDRMRRIEREVLVLGSLEQVELDEARHLVQLRVAAEPHFLERLFGPLLHPEAVHGNEHLCFSSLTIEVSPSSMPLLRRKPAAMQGDGLCHPPLNVTSLNRTVSAPLIVIPGLKNGGVVEFTPWPGL